MLFGYACHCTTLGGEFNKICAEWAGYACDEIERQSPGAIALAIIGCGADANPEPRRNLDDAKQHGAGRGREVDRLVKSALTPLPGRIPSRFRKIELPLEPLPDRARARAAAEAAPAAEGFLARTLIERLDRGESLPTTVPYVVQTWCFGDDMAMVFLAGEVVVDYALRLKWEIDAEPALGRRLQQRRALLHPLAADPQRGRLRGRFLDDLLRPPVAARPGDRGPDHPGRPRPSARPVRRAAEALKSRLVASAGPRSRSSRASSACRAARAPDGSEDVAGGHFRLAGIDPDQRAAAVPGRCSRRCMRTVGTAWPAPHSTTTTLASSSDVEPRLIRRIWASVARGVPAPVAEHEDVRPARAPQRGQTGKGGDRPHSLRVDLDCERLARKNADAAFAGALHSIEGAVNLDDPLRVEAGALELAVDVGREDESSRAASGPAQRREDREPRVGSGLPVETHPVPVEAPGQRRVLGKPARVGQSDEIEPEPLYGG